MLHQSKDTWLVEMQLEVQKCRSKTLKYLK